MKFKKIFYFFKLKRENYVQNNFPTVSIKDFYRPSNILAYVQAIRKAHMDWNCQKAK